MKTKNDFQDYRFSCILSLIPIDRQMINVQTIVHLFFIYSAQNKIHYNILSVKYVYHHC